MVNSTEAGRTGKRRRAVIYTRQSAAREESISLEVQEQACREYARSRGYDVVGDVIRDPGVSGLYLDKRPGIRRAMELVEERQADVILVWRWSRLSRQRTHQAVILDRIESAGGRVESALEPIDTTTAGGEFGRDVLLSMAAYESRQKSEGWREAQARRVRNGLSSGGPPPFGYAKGPKGSPHVPHPEHADVVSEMYSRYLQGQGWQGLSKWLNDQGLRTSRGKVFTSTSVARLLDSGYAAGWLQLHDPECDAPRRPRDNHLAACERRVRIRGAHEPLIDQATWEAYEQERDRRRGLPPKARSAGWWLGGGLVTCGRCGGPLTVNSYTAAKSQAVCSVYKGSRSCDGTWINRVRLESVIGVWLGSRVDEWANKAKRVDTDVKKERAALERQIDRAQKAEKKLRDGLARAAAMVMRGDMDETGYAGQKEKVDKELADIVSRAEDLRHRHAALDPSEPAMERVAEWMVASFEPDGRRPDHPEVPLPTGGVTPAEWNSVVKKIIRRVVVGFDTITIEPWTGEPAVFNRALHAPRRPRRKTETAHDAKGRFVSGRPTDWVLDSWAQAQPRPAEGLGLRAEIGTRFGNRAEGGLGPLRGV